MNKFKSKGEKIKVREKPRNEWIPVSIPQIIGHDTWERAQDALKKMKHTSIGRPTAEYILAPLMLCGICGSRLNGKSVFRNETTYRYYICANKYGASREKCTARLINADAMEEMVWNYICERILNYLREEANIKDIIDEYISLDEIDIEEIENKIRKMKEERNRVMLMFQKGFIDENEMCTRFLENGKKLKNLEVLLLRKNEYKAGRIDKLRQEWKAENFPYIIQILLKRMNRAEKAQLLHIMINEIRVAGNIITINERP